MRFEDVLPLMKKDIRCKCDGVYWTANEHHEWLRWCGSSYRIDPSGPSNDQILGGEWEREGGAQDPFYAVGCADNIALGAMYATQGKGMNPEERVRLALQAAERYSAGVRGPFAIECLEAKA